MIQRFSACVLFLLFSIFNIESLAQSSVRLGEMVRQTMKESWADIEPLGTDKEGVYYMAIPYTAVMSGIVVGDNDYYLFLVNNAAERVKTNPANFTVEGKPSKYEFTEQINGRILVFTSVENKREKTVTFYALELDTQNLELVNPRKVVELSFAQLKRDYERASFKAELSRDKSKLLISYALVDKHNTMLSFGYVLLNSAMKELYKWSGGLDMSEGVYLFDQFRVSNKGEVYLATRYFQNEKAHDKNVKMKKAHFFSSTRSMEYKKNYEHRIVKFESNETTIIAIPNKERFYDVLDLQIAPDGNLVLIGFYSPNQEELMPVGATCMTLNVKTGAIKESTKEFGNAYELPSDMSIKNNGLTAGKDQYLKYRFIISDIHFNKSGGYTLIGERNVTQTKVSGQSVYTVNHFDDLAVVDVSAAGVVTAVHKVEKSQQAEGFGFFNASYFYAEHNNNKYFAFANLGKSRFNETVLVTIAADGKQTRQMLFNRKDSEVTIRPKDCEFVNGNLVMYGNKNNRYCRWISKEL